MRKLVSLNKQEDAPCITLKSSRPPHSSKLSESHQRQVGCPVTVITAYCWKRFCMSLGDILRDSKKPIVWIGLGASAVGVGMMIGSFIPFIHSEGCPVGSPFCTVHHQHA